MRTCSLNDSLMHHPHHPRRPGQRGMALVVVLIMISIIFVIAAVSSRVVTLGERAARNDRDRQTALQSAEAALSDAEMDIMGPNTHREQRVAMFGTLPADQGCSSVDTTRGFCGGLASGDYKTIFADETSAAPVTPPLASSPAVPTRLPGLHHRCAAGQVAALHHRKVTGQLPQPRRHGGRTL